MNVIGHFKNTGSLPRVANDNARILAKLLGYNQSKKVSFPQEIGQALPFNVTYLHVNPTPGNVARLRQWRRPGGPLYVYWCGEVDKLQSSWSEALQLLKPDKVFTLSKFFKDVLASELGVSSHVVPHYIPPHERREHNGPFTFLISYDAKSRVSRKNPEAGIAAFLKLFKGNPDVKLVVKTGGADVAEHRWLNQLSDNAENVEVINAFQPRGKFESLFFSADCYLSSHRAEGFGLHLAEAMAAGIPTIGTNYSGNLEFMTPKNSWLVPGELVPVKDSWFPSGSSWCEVIPEELEAAMLDVFNGGAKVDKRANSGRTRVKKVCSEKAVSNAFKLAFP